MISVEITLYNCCCKKNFCIDQGLFLRSQRLMCLGASKGKKIAVTAAITIMKSKKKRGPKKQSKEVKKRHERKRVAKRTGKEKDKSGGVSGTLAAGKFVVSLILRQKWADKKMPLNQLHNLKR